MHTVDVFEERQGFATRTAAIVSHCRLSQMHLSVFSCIPSQVFEVKHGDLAFSWVATADEPVSDRYGLLHSLCLCPSLSLSFSLQQRWRELSRLSRVLNQSRPLYGQARGGPEGGDTKGSLEQLSGSKVFITSRSWPLSTPVEPTAFDCLLVLLYLPGVIRLHWHMLKAVSFDNQAGGRGGCSAYVPQNMHTRWCFSVYLQWELNNMHLYFD